MTFGGDVTRVVPNGSKQVIFSNTTDFEAYGGIGRQWRTRRLSCEGFRTIRIEVDGLVGRAWNFADDRWIESKFSLPLEKQPAVRSPCRRIGV